MLFCTFGAKGHETGKNLAVSKKTDTKWNSSSFYGTVPLFVEQRPKNVKQLPKKVEQVL